METDGYVNKQPHISTDSSTNTNPVSSKQQLRSIKADSTSAPQVGTTETANVGNRIPIQHIHTTSNQTANIEPVHNHEPAVKIHSSVPLTDKEAARLTKQRLKVELATKKQKLSTMKKDAKKLKGRITKPQRTDHALIEEGVANLGIARSAKAMLPTAERMASYLELQSLNKQISVKENQIAGISKELHDLTPGKLNPAKAALGKFLGEIGKLGLEARGWGVGADVLLSPMVYYHGIIDSVWNMAWMRTGASVISETRGIKELLKVGEQRLAELDGLQAHIDPHSEKGQILAKERELMEAAVAELKVALEQLPVAEIVEQNVANLIKAQYSLARVAEAVTGMITWISPAISAAQSVLGVTLPHAAHLASNAAAVAGPASTIFAIATLPGVVFTSLRGIWGCRRNLIRCRQDLRFASEARKTGIENVRLNAEGFHDIFNMPEVRLHPPLSGLRLNIHAVQTRSDELERGIQAIDQKLLAGNLKKDQIKELKGERANLRAEKALLHDEVEAMVQQKMADPSTTPATQEVLKKVVSRLNAKKTLATTATTLESTLVPYIQQKAKTKAIMEGVRLTADGLTITSAVVTTVGIVSTPFAPHVGLAALVTGMGIGYCGLAVAYPVAGLVKKLRTMYLEKAHISTEQFNSAFKAQLNKEIAMWPQLEAAGLEDQTATSLMFEVMKKHYREMPKEWGPKEWAQALAADPPGGKQWKQYDEALNHLRHHDQRSLGSGAARWIANKIKSRKTPKTARI